MQAQAARFLEIFPVSIVPMNDVGKILMAIGLGLVALGALVWLAGKTGLPLGHLPGDININRPGFKFSFPLTTCLLLSALLTLVLWLLRRR
jgi:hypothetical protein